MAASTSTSTPSFIAAETKEQSPERLGGMKQWQGKNFKPERSSRGSGSRICTIAFFFRMLREHPHWFTIYWFIRTGVVFTGSERRFVASPL